MEKLDLDGLGTVDEALVRIDALSEHYDAIGTIVFREFEPLALTPVSMAWLSLLTRLQGLHDGIACEIRAENPHAACPLVRSLAETVAMLIYLLDKPEYALALFDPHEEAPRVKPRDLINHAKTRMAGIGPIYGELSAITHFDRLAYSLPFVVTDKEERIMEWRSRPAWKNERQALIACGWLIELAEASHDLLTDFADEHLHPYDEDEDGGR